MKVSVLRNETSLPIVYENALNAYTKGNMYCILIEINGEKITHKFPLCSIFRIDEDWKDYPKREL